MAINLFLILSCILGTTLPFHIDEGCEAKAEWETKITWPEFHIGSWTSTGNSKILELKITFRGKHEDLTYDAIKLSRDRYEFIKMRDLTKYSTFYNVSEIVTDGWNKFIFRIDKNYTLMHVLADERHLLVKQEVEQNVDLLIIKGSNITLNCPTALRMWNVVGESSSVVPLDTSENNNLSFYSGNPMSPSILIESREYSLGWNGHTITTLSGGKPLPPYQLHNISLTCSSASKLKCIIQTTNGNQLEDVPMSKLPDHVSVKRTSGDQFSVMLFGIQDHTSEPEVVTKTTPIPKPDVASATTTAAILIVFLIIFILLAIGLISLVCYLYRKSKATDKQTTLEEQGLLLKSGQNSTEEYERNELLEAVRRNDPHQVKILLNQIDKNSSAYEKAHLEAHLLRRYDIIEIFESITEGPLKPLKPQSRETTIINVMRKFDERVKEVFEAAQKGQYYQGVGQLLLKYQMPATIRDAQGRSLIHVIASAKGAEGAPLWSLQNLKAFLQNKSCYANAIDFRGKTCLHLLVEAVRNPNAPVTWYNKEMKSEAAWIEMAEELVSFGCDPSIKDTDGRLPHELAKQTRTLNLAEYLQKEWESTQSKKTPNSEISDDEKSEFNALIKEARANNTLSLMKKMNCLRELLPLNATTNPLTESVASGHMEASLLLLSGGAWICGWSLVSITPLEVAHVQKTLPVIFPAIIRRECANRLRFEKPDTSKDKKLEKLRYHIEKLSSNVENGILTVYRHNASGVEENISKECRNLLCTAAELGFPLTCQMLGLENVDLQPHPNEKKPILEAIEKRKHEVAYILYRDLQMSAFAHTDTEKLLESFRDEIWLYEFGQLKKVYDKETLEISKAHKESQRISIPKYVLSYIAKQGLVYTFHTIKDKIENFTISDIVDDVTGCTMLHIAAMFGRFSMIEYLLNDKQIQIMGTAKGGFTAAHLAAIKGNKECMQYIQVYMKEDYGQPDVVSDGGQDCCQLLKGYGNLVKDFDLSFVSDDTGLDALSELSTPNKAKVILKEKFKGNKVSDNASFREFVNNSPATDSFECVIVREMEGLLNSVSEHDDRFEGDIVAHYSNAKGLQIPLESLQIYWEVNSKVFNDFKIKSQEKEDLSNLDIEFTSEDLGHDFSDKFYEAVMKTAENFSFKSDLIWLIYPAVLKGNLGVTLLLAIYGTGKLRLVSVLLVPVLKLDYPEENKIEPVRTLINDIEPSVYLAKANRSWALITVRLEEDIMSLLKDEQKLVLQGCKILTRILYSCWWYPKFERMRHYITRDARAIDTLPDRVLTLWYPKFESRRHSSNWDAHAFGIGTLPDRVLTSLFLEEVSSRKNDDWEHTEFLSNVIAVFRRAVEDNNGQPHPDSTVKLFLDYHHSTYKVNTIIPVIIEFLESLPQC